MGARHYMSRFGGRLCDLYVESVSNSDIAPSAGQARRLSCVALGKLPNLSELSFNIWGCEDWCGLPSLPTLGSSPPSSYLALSDTLHLSLLSSFAPAVPFAYTPSPHHRLLHVSAQISPFSEPPSW